MYEVRERWVQEPDEDYCEIIEEGYNYNDEPNGWYLITYQVDSRGRSVPVKDWT